MADWELLTGGSTTTDSALDVFDELDRTESPYINIFAPGTHSGQDLPDGCSIIVTFAMMGLIGRGHDAVDFFLPGKPYPIHIYDTAGNEYTKFDYNGRCAPGYFLDYLDAYDDYPPFGNTPREGRGYGEPNITFVVASCHGAKGLKFGKDKIVVEHERRVRRGQDATPPVAGITDFLFGGPNERSYSRWLSWVALSGIGKPQERPSQTVLPNYSRGAQLGDVAVNATNGLPSVFRSAGEYSLPGPGVLIGLDGVLDSASIYDTVDLPPTTDLTVPRKIAQSPPYPYAYQFMRRYDYAFPAVGVTSTVDPNRGGDGATAANLLVVPEPYRDEYQAYSPGDPIPVGELDLIEGPGVPPLKKGLLVGVVASTRVRAADVFKTGGGGGSGGFVEIGWDVDGRARGDWKLGAAGPLVQYPTGFTPGLGSQRVYNDVVPATFNGGDVPGVPQAERVVQVVIYLRDADPSANPGDLSRGQFVDFSGRNDYPYPFWHDLASDEAYPNPNRKPFDPAPTHRGDNALRAAWGGEALAPFWKPGFLPLPQLFRACVLFYEPAQAVGLAIDAEAFRGTLFGVPSAKGINIRRWQFGNTGPFDPDVLATNGASDANPVLEQVDGARDVLLFVRGGSVYWCYSDSCGRDWSVPVLLFENAGQPEVVHAPFMGTVFACLSDGRLLLAYQGPGDTAPGPQQTALDTALAPLQLDASAGYALDCEGSSTHYLLLLAQKQGEHSFGVWRSSDYATPTITFERVV